MRPAPLTRRRLLQTAAIAGTTLPLAQAASAQSTDDFAFEVTRSEAEWREMLSPEEYAILRENDTEFPTTSPYWNDYTPGRFACRGCDLHLYGPEWRAQVEMGFVFWYHSHPNAVLTALDEGDPYGSMKDGGPGLIEVHCRRCGSHLGHIVNVEGDLVHCINGTSLVRTEISA